MYNIAKNKQGNMMDGFTQMEIMNLLSQKKEEVN